ncbi:NAD(P)-binding domain-containing protein [Microbacterium sp.]|uniref:NAD(P)-binding domain-containing protein n=1 Tax=Microbacterium sp. TaxID=51671 RepID=UPI0039E54DA8
MPLPAVTILGVGAMGGSILQGLLESGIDIRGGLRISDQWSERVAELSRYSNVVGFDGAADADANRRAVQDAGVVIVAARPHQIRDVLAES